MKAADNSVIMPGYGSQTLHVGQAECEVVGALGKPESRTRKYKGQYFYNYPSRGLQVDFDQQNGERVANLFYFRDGVGGNRQANVTTDTGIRPGDTRKKVLKLLGDSDEKGSPEILSSGARFGDRFRYRTGINLEFDEDGRVNMITVTRDQEVFHRLVRPLPELPRIIPPLSVVKLKCGLPDWSDQGGAIFRTGYYGKADGLDCVWLVNREGKYEQATDQDSIQNDFVIIEQSEEEDLFGIERPIIGPL